MVRKMYLISEIISGKEMELHIYQVVFGRKICKVVKTVSLTGGFIDSKL